MLCKICFTIILCWLHLKRIWHTMCQKIVRHIWHTYRKICFTCGLLSFTWGNFDTLCVIFAFVPGPIYSVCPNIRSVRIRVIPVGLMLIILILLWTHKHIEWRKWNLNVYSYFKINQQGIYSYIFQFYWNSSPGNLFPNVRFQYTLFMIFVYKQSKFLLLLKDDTIPNPKISALVRGNFIYTIIWQSQHRILGNVQLILTKTNKLSTIFIRNFLKDSQFVSELKLFIAKKNLIYSEHFSLLMKRLVNTLYLKFFAH
jgi:hypothetical protein